MSRSFTLISPFRFIHTLMSEIEIYKTESELNLYLIGYDADPFYYARYTAGEWSTRDTHNPRYGSFREWLKVYVPTVTEKTLDELQARINDMLNTQVRKD